MKHPFLFILCWSLGYGFSCCLAAPDGKRTGTRTATPVPKAQVHLEKYVIAIEPRVLQTATARPLAQSKSTILSPATETPSGLTILDADQWKHLGLTWEEFLTKAKEAAAKHLESLKPESIKDERGTVSHIKLFSESHLTSSILLCPELFARFSPILGTEIIVIVPDRFTLFLFPRRTSSFVKHGPEIAALFAAATYPASDEAFELTETGLKSIGNFNTDGSQ